MRKSLFISALALYGSLGAECILDCNSNECYTPPYYDMECDCGIFVSGDFLYWYGREEGLSYALKAETIVQTTRPAGSPVWNLAPVQYKYFGTEWRPGVRIGLGAKSDCDGWDYSLDWTYYLNKAKSSFSVPPFGAILPSVGEFGLINPWSSPTVNVNAYFTNITGKWRFRFNNVDFELGRRYWLSPCFTLRPFVGARGAWTKTTLRLNSTHDNAVDQIDVPLLVANFFYKDFFKNRFWGAGPLVGLQPTWHFTSWFSLFGEADLALLWGKFKIQKKEDYLITAFSVSNGTLISNTNYLVNPKSQLFSMQPILDLAVGLRLDACFCNSRFRFAFDAGWEHHVWWNHVTRYQPTGVHQVGIFVNNQTTIQAQTGYTELEHDLVFGGAMVRARLDF